MLDVAKSVNEIALNDGIDKLNFAYLPGNSQGVVYLIKPEEGVVKIGRSAGNPKNRLRDISFTLYDKDVRLAYYTKNTDYKLLEKVLHLGFRQFRIKGEWFRVDADEVVWYTKRRLHWIKGEELENDAISLGC